MSDNSSQGSESLLSRRIRQMTATGFERDRAVFR